MSENDLKLDDSVFRFLFSSPAPFVGECSGQGFYLTIAFPSWGRRSPSNRSRDDSNFVLSIRTEPQNKKTIQIETYQWIGEEVSALLGAFYGKLIQNYGHIQCGNVHTVPTALGAPVGKRDRTPYNSVPRRPDGPTLDLSEARRVVETYMVSQGGERVGWILRAAEFYRVALESFHSRPEVALAMFCSALEALLPLREYTENELCDTSLASMLQRISEHCPNGDRIVKALKSRLYQIKRKVAAFVGQYVPEGYFQQRETTIGWAVAKDRADLISRIRCVYDLRSKVLHTGDRKGLNYIEHDHEQSEIGIGFPVLDDKQLEKTLAGALTLTGVERVTSTVLRAVIAEWLGTPKPEPSTAK